MDLVAVQQARAQGDKRYPQLSGLGLFRGLPIVAQRGNGLGNGAFSNGTDTSTTYRYGHRIVTSCFDVRLVYANYSAGADGNAAITVKATVEPPTTVTQGSGAAASVYPVTFAGAANVTIQPGAFAVSDPVPLYATAGKFIYTRTFVSVGSAGQKWPISQYVGGGDTAAANYQDVFKAGVDATAAGAIASGTSFGAGYGPSAIIGVPAVGATRPKVFVGIGDSRLFGSGATQQDYGWFQLSSYANGLALMTLAHPSETAATFQGVGRRQRMPLATGCTHAICEYLINDVGAGTSAAVTEGYLLDIWTDLAARGIRVFQTTGEPVASSTDRFTTVGAQTTSTNNAVRVAVNNWIRAGSPIDPSTKAPVAVGTSGALLAGATGHPLAVCTAATKGYIEVADVVESARDSGLWKAAERAVTDAAMTAASSTLTSATAAFTSADVGKTISLAGAAAAGAVLNTTIAGFTNATTVTVNNAAGTTVSGAALAIAPWTADGTHPTTSGHNAIAAVVNLGNLN